MESLSSIKNTTRAALMLRLAKEKDSENEAFEAVSTNNILMGAPNAVPVLDGNKSENIPFSASCSTLTKIVLPPICSDEKIVEATDVLIPNLELNNTNELEGVFEHEVTFLEKLFDYNIIEAQLEGAGYVGHYYTDNGTEQFSESFNENMSNSMTEMGKVCVVSGYNNNKENNLEKDNKSNKQVNGESNGNFDEVSVNMKLLEAEDYVDEEITESPIGRPKKGRKRKFPAQNREIRKLRCIQNKKYFTQKGNIKAKKEFRQCLCRCKCFSRIGEEKVREEFEKFYKVISHDAQRALICAIISECPIKRKRVKGSQKRSSTKQYKINGIIVCKQFFLQTFRISSGKVNLALKTLKKPEGVKDCRGIGGGKNKISAERLQKVVDHIEKFPKYKSHYSRGKTDALYLRSDTTMPVMYNLYKQETNISPVSFSKYKNIFLTHFNLRKKPLKKDTFNTCDRLEILKSTGTFEEQNKFTDERNNHLKLPYEARSLLKADRKRAQEDKHLEVLCFDLEKTLPLPRIPTNIVFYKRQLWLYNAGIHSAKNNKGHCYVWLKGEAGRGAQEVGSYLYKHIMQDKDLVECQHLILWSDSCGGQNRNIKIVLLLKAAMAAHPNVTKITMRFLVSGHSFLPNDTDFGDIECALKLQQRMYSPDDYINVLRSCRRKNPRIVHRMERENFCSTTALEKSIVNRKIDVEKNKVNWLHFREIELRDEHPFSIFVKTNFESNAQEINLEKKLGRPLKSNSFVTKCQKLDTLWPNGKPIVENKLLNLKSLMTFIPDDVKNFYKNLIGEPDIEEDIDGFNNKLDFDLELNLL